MKPIRPISLCQCGVLPALVLSSAVAVSITFGATNSNIARPLPKTADEFFGLTNLWTIHLTVSKADWEGLGLGAPGMPMEMPFEPRRGPRFEFPAGPPQPGMPFRPRIVRMGISPNDLAYVRADVEVAGHKLENVGLRLKGHSSLMSSAHVMKRPFKIDFNRFVKGQKFLGLGKLNLNNNAMDPSQMREALCYDIFHQAGVVASRTAYAMVYLTVPGEHSHQYLGLYTVIEQVDGNFLEDRFGDKDGLLVKPEVSPGLRYLGENWAAYRKPYEAKNEPTPAVARRFIEFIKLVTSSDEAAFREHLEEFTEVEQFLRLLAVTVAVADSDSILGMGHNFYLFEQERGGKVVWIPWDLNLSLGSTTGRQGLDLSIRKPAPPHNRIVEWILRDERWIAIYKGHLRKLLGGAFQPVRTVRLAETLRLLLRGAVALESQGSLDQFERAVTGGTATAPGGTGFAVWPGVQPSQMMPFATGGGFAVRGPPPQFPLQQWLAARAENIDAQLAGRSEGRPSGGIRGPGFRLGHGPELPVGEGR